MPRITIRANRERPGIKRLKQKFNLIITLIVLGYSLVGGLVFVAPQNALAGSGPNGMNGSGTAVDPYQITSCTDLQSISDNVNAAYVLTSDIDCSATTGWNDGAGFIPIAGNGTVLDGRGHTISGLYISADLDNGDTGLFGQAYDTTIQNLNLVGATVIANSTSDILFPFVGGLIGQATGRGSIRNDSFNGSVTLSCSGEGSISAGIVGGLIGEEGGINVSGSSSTGSLTDDCSNGGSDYLGGMIGFAASSNLDNDYSRTNILDTSGSTLGGLVGQWNSDGTDSINQSYSSGSLNYTGTSETVGGLVGVLSSSDFVITNSFTTSTIDTTSCSACGAISGWSEVSGGPYDYSTDYYDQTAVGLSNCDGSGSTSCNAINTDGSQPDYFDSNSTNPPLNSWSFSSTWQISSGNLPVFRPYIDPSPGPPTGLSGISTSASSINLSWAVPTNTGDSAISDYIIQYEQPGASYWNQIDTASTATTYDLSGLLANQTYNLEVFAENANGNYSPASTIFTATTPAASTHFISTCQDLQNMNNDLVGNYILTQNIDCSGTASWNGGTGFIPVGGCGGGECANPSQAPFTGTLEGNNFSITGLYENETTPSSGFGTIGLFGYIQSATISNLIIASPNLTDAVNDGGSINSGAGGSLAFGATDSSIANIQVTGAVISSPGTFSSIGGLAGYLSGSAVIQSSFSGSITTGAGGEVGGLFESISDDQNLATIANSYVQANIIGSWIGGLVGDDEGAISTSYAAGSLTAIGDGQGDESYVGGLVASNDTNGGDLITNSFSNMSINTTADPATVIGGLVGRDYGDPSVIDTSDYFDATLAGTNNCTGDAFDSCSPINTIASWAPTGGIDPSDATTADLSGVSCTSPTHCVAAGTYTDTNGIQHALIETYNGSSWTPITGIDPGDSTGYAALDSISCNSATSCVAVGNYDDSTGQSFLIETYNGSSWTPTTGIDPVDNGGIRDLTGVSCTSPTHCVAAGYYQDSNYENHALIETYNGSSWTPTTGIDPSDAEGDTFLTGISCTSATSCVAVGNYNDFDENGSAFAENLSGGVWTPTTGIDPSDAANTTLQSISCTSSTHCVAAGYYTDINAIQHALTETFSGGTWSATSLDPAPNPFLNGISCTSSTNCVAVGGYYNNGYYGLIETFNGSSWTPVTAIGGSESPLLNSVSCTSSTSCIAAGEYDSNSTGHALIESLVPGDPSPNPAYFDATTSVPPLNIWNFTSIWQTTSGLPIFIPNQIVTPVTPSVNPNYKPKPPKPPAPAPSPSGQASSPKASSHLPSIIATISGNGTGNGGGGILGAIKNFILHAPAIVVVNFPYALFALLLLGSLIAFFMLLAELQRLKRTNELLAKQRALAEERDTFWHLAANYLRAPITLVVGAAEELSENGATAAIKGVQVLANQLQSKVAGIMHEIETSKTLVEIAPPKQAPGRRRILGQPRFWIPVLVVGALAVSSDLLAANFRHLNTSFITYATQVTIFVIVAVAFYWMLTLLQAGRSRRRSAELLYQQQTSGLDSARKTLINRTTKDLGANVTELEALIPHLEESGQAIETLTEGTSRLRQIVDTFKLLVEVEAEQAVAAAGTVVTASKGSTNLDGLLAALRSSTAAMASAKHIKLALPGNTQLTLPGSSRYLRQVISSVVVNAIEFSPKAGTVTIQASAAVGGGTCLTVSDQGQGIAKDQLTHLFQPFSRADGLQAIQLNHGGLGLNLYIDKLIMESIGGTIQATSETGHGTSVTLTWPKASEAKETTTATTSGRPAMVYPHNYRG